MAETGSFWEKWQSLHLHTHHTARPTSTELSAGRTGCMIDDAAQLGDRKHQYTNRLTFRHALRALSVDDKDFATAGRIKLP